MTHSTAEEGAPSVTRYAHCSLPTEFGDFDVTVFRDGEGREHLSIVSDRSAVSGRSNVLVRIHSECLTGEVLHSRKCDCREQLHLALRRIADDGGVVLYLRQEGRGIGLGNKIRAYAAQEKGHDTVDANRVLGFEDDLRSYEMVREMLAELDLQSIALMTNNPAKVDAIRALGIRVTRTEHFVEPHAQNRAYLETKRVRMAHMIQAPSESTTPPVQVHPKQSEG